MPEIAMEALLTVLRRAAQIEAGREDIPFAEDAASECQKRGWLDSDLQLTASGRVVLTVYQGSEPGAE